MINFEFIGNIKDDIQLWSAEKIVIYGCGKNGKELYNFLTKAGLRNRIQAFCDGNAKIWNTFYGATPILPPSDCGDKYPDAVYLIGSCMIKPMYEVLMGVGVKRIHVTRCDE